MQNKLHQICHQLLTAYKTGLLGNTSMPEDSHPDFVKLTSEQRLSYFTLPMALNYQRDSYKLWQAALQTWSDPETNYVFDVAWCAKTNTEILRGYLLKYKLALQPNKHIQTWQTIANTIYSRWGSMADFISTINNDFLVLKEIVQTKYKKGLPYLSGPKIFNYWSFILFSYGGVNLINREHIEIAPDTHVIQCSIRLGIITKDEANSMTRDQISRRWRDTLQGSGITPIDMHPPLWFWSRNGFKYKLKNT